jgi:hypothetical protein
MHHLAAFALIRYSSSRLFAKLRDRDAHCLARTARTPQSQEFSSFEVRVRSTRRRVARCRTPHAARVTLSSARMWESSCRQLDHQIKISCRPSTSRIPLADASDARATGRTPRARTRVRPPSTPSRSPDPRLTLAPPFPVSRLARPPVRLHASSHGCSSRSATFSHDPPDRAARLARDTPTDRHRHTQTHTRTPTCPASAGPAFPRAPSR